MDSGHDVAGDGGSGDSARDPAGAFVAIIDPGPKDDAHRDALIEAALSMARGLTGEEQPRRDMAPGDDDGVRSVDVVVLLTHHHDDHEGGAGALVEALRASASEGAWASPGVPFAGVTVCGGAQGREFIDGELFGDLQVVRAPGHTRDSVAFLLERDGRRVLFSGDTVLGAGSSFVAHPDGDLTAYLATLDVLAELTVGALTAGEPAIGDPAGREPGEGRVDAGGAAHLVGGAGVDRGADAGSAVNSGRLGEASDPEGEHPARVMLAPGHGPVGGDAGAVIAQYREHRAARLDEVRAALVGVESSVVGDELVDVVVRAVYADVDASLRPSCVRSWPISGGSDPIASLQTDDAPRGPCR